MGEVGELEFLSDEETKHVNIFKFITLCSDRYGFKKASQWITLENHREFDETYIPILERRSIKWQNLLEEYEPKLPERSSKGILKKEIGKGKKIGTGIHVGQKN